MTDTTPTEDYTPTGHPDRKRWPLNGDDLAAHAALLDGAVVAAAAAQQAEVDRQVAILVAARLADHDALHVEGPG